MFNSIHLYVNKNKILFLLIGLASVFYWYIIHTLGGLDFVRNGLYSTPDSLEYKEYADWIAGRIESNSPKRTFFYPLLILVSDALMGYLGIWILQFLFWICGCVLVFETMMRLTYRPGLALLSFLLAASNISLIFFSAYALTELATFFFLSLLMHLLARYYKDLRNLRLGTALLFVLSILAAIRPVFQPLWYLIVIVFLLLQTRQLLRQPLFLLLIILALSPVLIQKAINLKNYGSGSSTEIANINLRNYFYRKVNFTVESPSPREFNHLPDSVHVAMQAAIEHVGKEEIMEYFLEYPGTTLWVYWDNVRENLRSGNAYINRETNRSLWKWTQNTNQNFVFFIHLVMTLLWLIYLVLFFRPGNKASRFVLFSGLVLFYLLYTTGVTYWAGDRLVLPTLSIWSILYPFLVFIIGFQRQHKANSIRKTEDE